MNTRNFKIYTLLLGLVLALFACSPDEFNLGGVLSKSDLNYRITQDAADPNMVILESLTPGVTPLWITPMGRSTRVKDTLRFPFAGDYQFIYGVESAGGLVQADAYPLSITTNNFDYVNDPLWTLLTGGVGQSKTWVLDLFTKDVAPTYGKYFKGPLFFYGTNDSWESVTNGVAVGGDSWNWQADWVGNGSWMFGSETRLDYGTMTFDLIDGAHLTTDHLILGRQESGTFMLDAVNHTMRSTDAYILHDAGRDGVVIDWGDLKVMSLTENTMQLAALRDPALSGEGACLLVYNFISKDYSDNWVAPETAEPEPALPDGWQDDVSQVVSTKIVWKLSESNPLDWANLDGSRMNGWDEPSDYPDWLGTPDTGVYGNFSMTMNSSDGTITFKTPDGTETSGNYTLDEKGIYSFDVTVPTFTIINWASFGADANNQLRILQLEKDATGAVTGMWLGKRDSDPAKAEYMAYHLVPQSGSTASDPLTVAKQVITAKTWMLDSGRTYDKTTSWGAEQGPVIFSDYATWAWNPLPGQHYASGEADVDYGTVKFEMDGTVVVKQRKRVYTYVDTESGATVVRNGSPQTGDVLQSDNLETLTGTWALDLDANTITMSVGMLHPWTCDFAVADWGAITIYRLESGALLLQEQRDATLSGEGAMPMTYIFVPAN